MFIYHNCSIFAPLNQMRIKNMNWNELKKKALKAGFVFVKHGARHDEYYNPKTNKTIQLERHWSQEVRKGLASKLKREIGF